MILSRTSQYALQALIYIASQPRGQPVLNRQMADDLDIPPAYLAKIMQILCKGNLLYSFRGRLGGFCLREGASKASVMDVLDLTEGKDFTETCVMGLKLCADASACPMHPTWQPIRERVVKTFRNYTLEKLARGVQGGKYQISDVPMMMSLR